MRRCSVRVLTTRVDDQTIRDLDAIAADERADRSEVARKLLDRSIRDWKLEKALKMISSSAWTVRRAAKFAGLSYYQMIEEMSARDVDSGPRPEDLEQSG